MYGSAIPRVMSKHPWPQPSPKISHYDFALVNCTQKKAWRPLDGDRDLESRELRFTDGGAQAVCLVLFAQKTSHSGGYCLFCVSNEGGI